MNIVDFMLEVEGVELFMQRKFRRKKTLQSNIYTYILKKSNISYYRTLQKKNKSKAFTSKPRCFIIKITLLAKVSRLGEVLDFYLNFCYLHM